MGLSLAQFVQLGDEQSGGTRDVGYEDATIIGSQRTYFGRGVVDGSGFKAKSTTGCVLGV